MNGKLLTIDIFQVVDLINQERVKFGSVKLKYSTDKPRIMFLDEERVEVLNSKELFFSATYDLSSENISLFIREGETHIFTGIFHLGYKATYFAFVLSDGIFTELFFKF